MTNKKQWYNLKPKKLIKLVDPSLKYVERINRRRINPIYLVKSKHGLATLRMSPYHLINLDTEKTALKMLEGVEGVPQFYDSYQKRGLYNAILKEHVIGKNLDKFDNKKDPELQEKIEKLFSNMISKGVIILDPHEKNIIISKTWSKGTQAHITDFEEAVFSVQSDFKDYADIFYRYGRRNFFPNL